MVKIVDVGMIAESRKLLKDLFKTLIELSKIFEFTSDSAFVKYI